MSESAPLSKLCLHTITTKSLALPQAIAAYQQAGVAAITVWRDALLPLGIAESAKLLKSSGLTVVSLCRGGFFVAPTAADRRSAIDENRHAIDESAAIGSPLVVLVCGAHPQVPLPDARRQIVDALRELAPYAAERNVKLGIEPLHPVYADTRSAVSTLGQANDMVERIKAKNVGVALDVYHTWWDDKLETEIARCGKLDALFSFHVCDWHIPTRDILNDRGLMGEGCIPLRKIRSWVEQTGYDGFIEAEIFSTERWAQEPIEYIEQIKKAYFQHV